MRLTRFLLHGAGWFFVMGAVLGTSPGVSASPQIIYEQYASWNSDLPLIEGSEPASDVTPDPLNWENRKEVGDLISLSAANSNVTRVDVLLGQWLNRSFTGDMVLKFYENNGGVPGAEFFQTSAPIVSNHTSGGAHPIDFSFTGFSEAVPQEFFYSVSVRNVSYTGGTGGYYLSQTGHPDAPTVGSSDTGYWELTQGNTWQLGNPFQNANVRVWSDTEESSSFGKQWVRSHPFTFSGRMDWTLNQAEFDLIANSQLNTVFSGYPDTLSYAGQNSFPWLGWRQGESLGTVTQYFNNYPGNIGWLNRDEPERNELAGVGQSAAELKALNPEGLVFTSAHSKGSVESPTYSYVDYLNDLIDIAGSHIVLSNTYPFYDNGTTDMNRWFDHVTTLRSVGLSRDVPYWMWVQSSSFPGQRLPSESDLRMSMFSAMSAGFTGILFYRYHAAPNYSGFLESDRVTPSSLYVSAGIAVNEGIRLGESLRYLTSTNLYFVRGGISPTPTGLNDWEPGAGDAIGIEDITIAGQAAAGRDGLVGFFEDDLGDDYFMLVNLNHGAGLTSAFTSVDFTIEFDSSIDFVWRLNRLTGNVEKLTLTDHVLNLTLAGGTGDLFKMGDGNFAGVSPPGDFDDDGVVAGADFLEWQRGFGSKYDSNDLANWRQHYGTDSQLATSTVSVPEPSNCATSLVTWLLLLLVGSHNHYVRVYDLFTFGNRAFGPDV